MPYLREADEVGHALWRASTMLMASQHKASGCRAKAMGRRRYCAYAPFAGNGRAPHIVE